jgi:glyoxylase-like metal-dependent hydrolase (beta-lactamase superfamily II)
MNIAWLLLTYDKLRTRETNMIGRILITTTLLLSGAAFPALAQDSAAAVLKRASAAMGEPRTLRYSGDGTGWTFGQAFQPGKAWPKIDIQSQTRTLNYASGSMREEIAFSRGEPQGGGGYPLSGQQKNDQYLSGSFAWNAMPAMAIPGSRFVGDRTHQLWITPHGILAAAARNNATVSWTAPRGGKSLAAVSFTEPGRFSATAFINDDYLVERVESRVPDTVLGENTVTTVYSSYRDYGGVKFPGRIQQSSGGFPVLDLTIKEVQPNVAADYAVPDNVRGETVRVAMEKVADGVWHVAGGSHNSVAIEMKDHLILVEAPLNDARSGLVVEEVKKLAPGKPIRYVINSHAHFDHAGGLRAAAAAGATVVVHANSKAYIERALATHSRIAPDLLTKSKRKAKVLAVNNRMTLKDATREVQIINIVESNHAAGFLMVYLPKEKFLIEADAYTPQPPGAKPPSPANANNVNLVVNIEGFRLAVDKILPLHGRVVTLADLYTTAGRTQPK